MNRIGTDLVDRLRAHQALLAEEAYLLGAALSVIDQLHADNTRLLEHAQMLQGQVSALKNAPGNGQKTAEAVEQ